MKRWAPWMIFAVLAVFAGWRQCNPAGQCQCAEKGHAAP